MCVCVRARARSCYLVQNSPGVRTKRRKALINARHMAFDLRNYTKIISDVSAALDAEITHALPETGKMKRVRIFCIYVVN